MKLVEPEEPTPSEKPAPPPRASIPVRQAVLLHLVIFLLVAVATTRIMWGPALLSGHSGWIDLARAVEFDAAIRAGDFFPTWSPDFYSGYGSPIFQFYAPLAYYLAEVPILVGFDYPTALKITQFLALFASGLAMYRLASTHFSGWAACLGGVFYMLAPYRLVDIYIRHALAEHCAFIWLPLIVWGTERFVSKSSRAGLVTGALSTAALIFTHNIMALIGLPACIGAGWLLASPKLALKPLLAAATVAVLGVGLASFFWWPAMSGRSLTQSEVSLTSGDYDFHLHFVEAWQFLDLHWRFGFSAGKFDDQMPLQIGLPHIFATLGSLVMILGGWQGPGEPGRRRTRWSIIGLTVMLVGVFMCCRWSQPLWEVLPLVKYVQFPWRFLALVVFGSSLCAAALADRFAALGDRPALLACASGLVILLAAYFPYYTQARFFVADARTKTLISLPASDVEAFHQAGVLILLGRDTTPADLRGMHERATSSDDFLPRAVLEKPAERPAQIIFATGGQVLETTTPRQNDYRARLQMPAAGQAGLHQFWFPGWQATIDGLPATTAPFGTSAIVSCDVPAGDHVVEFRYHGLPQRRAGLLVSLLSAVLVAGLAIFHRTLFPQPPENRPT